MSDFGERYNRACEELRKECDDMVKSGELTEEMANFRYYMVRDEILDAMPE